MANVIDMFSRLPKTQSPSHTPNREPNEKLIAFLKGLVDLANAGELRTLVVVGLLDTEEVIDGWQMDPNNPAYTKPYTHLGALFKVTQEMSEALVEPRNG